MNRWDGKRVLITGVAGTVGRELLRQLAQNMPKEMIGLDSNETELFFTQQEFVGNQCVNLYLADIRDLQQLVRQMDGIDVVIHAAAYKHVSLCEQGPRNAIHTNIIGTQNVIDAATVNHVERVIFTSSDKAVNPTSVMGTSKLMGERLMTAANSIRRGDAPVFASTRFGNVLGSRGSVIPLFARQIADGGPVTLTHPEMTRFIMTLKEAVRLVMDSVFLAQGGEVFVTKMPVARISDLADVMITELASDFGHDPDRISTRTIGTKAGEKLYEELMNEEEIRRTVELEQYFTIRPALRSVYDSATYEYSGLVRESVARPYNSANEPAMSRHDLQNYLQTHGLLAEALAAVSILPRTARVPSSSAEIGS